MTTRDHPGDLLSAYLDGELAPGEAGEVESHLAHCESCAAELDGLAHARRLVRELPPVPAPAGFTRSLIDERRRWTRRGTGLALAAAAVALLAGLALAEPAADRPDSTRGPLSLAGDSSRLDTRFGSPARDRPPPGSSGSSPAGGSSTTTAPGSTTSAPGPTTTTPGRDTGPDGESDPVTVGDRISEVATNLLELIGG